MSMEFEKMGAFGMTVFDAAEFLGLKHTTLQNKRYKGEGPKCHKIGKCWYYKKEDLIEWVEQIKQVYEPRYVR